jgi:hypothetical protein
MISWTMSSWQVMSGSAVAAGRELKERRQLASRLASFVFPSIIKW